MAEENAQVKEHDKKQEPPESPRPPASLQRPAPNSKGPWIKYNGPATLRIMDTAAWKSAGVESTKYVEWNLLNRKKVAKSEFTADELRYLLQQDGRFSEVQ